VRGRTEFGKYCAAHKEKQKGNANRATLARKLVAYLMAVDRGQRDFHVLEASHCTAA